MVDLDCMRNRNTSLTEEIAFILSQSVVETSIKIPAAWETEHVRIKNSNIIIGSRVTARNGVIAIAVDERGFRLYGKRAMRWERQEGHKQNTFNAGWLIIMHVELVLWGKPGRIKMANKMLKKLSFRVLWKKCICGELCWRLFWIKLWFSG